MTPLIILFICIPFCISQEINKQIISRVYDILFHFLNFRILIPRSPEVMYNAVLGGGATAGGLFEQVLRCFISFHILNIIPSITVFNFVCESKSS